MTDFQHFIRQLAKLKVDRSKGSPAPHKPLLLLSVIQSIDCGQISDNRILITSELVARFKDNWALLITDDRFVSNFSLPFFHLKTSGFWNLKTRSGSELLVTKSGSVSSLSSLKNSLAYAYFDDAIFECLIDAENRRIVIHFLLNTYFAGRALPARAIGIFDKIEEQILCEPATLYKKEGEAADEDEKFIRGGVFKKVIPKVYNYTCCISGMRVIATRDLQMIDACHIVPFAESHDDTITNGLSLSPNFHRAFDRYLLTINSNYEVIVSQDFTEGQAHSIKAFHGKKIFLPQDNKYHPAQQNLAWHNERFYALHS